MYKALVNVLVGYIRFFEYLCYGSTTLNILLLLYTVR